MSDDSESDKPAMVHRQRLDRALTAVHGLLILVRVARKAGVQFHPYHEELFARAEALHDDEVPPD